MNIDNENKEIAMIIALLHDIGRFDQAKELQSFREDINNYDHATLGVKLLFENSLIRKFLDDDKYDEIIKIAIANHSKYIVDFDNMSEIQVLHSKIIRDADKLDSFRAKYEDDIYTMANITKEEIENSLISDNILSDFMNNNELLEKIKKIVSECGKIIVDADKDSLEIELKEGNNNIVTKYDKLVQNILKEKLINLIPGSIFIGEENDDYINNFVADKYTFIVDPIDGTTNFSRQLNMSVISVALLKNDIPIIAVCYNPYVK